MELVPLKWELVPKSFQKACETYPKASTGAPGEPHGIPKGSQGAPKGSPGGPKDFPGAAREVPKGFQDHYGAPSGSLGEPLKPPQEPRVVPRRPQDPPKTPKFIFMQLVKNTVALNMKIHPFCDFWWSRWAPWRLHSKHYLLYFASFLGLQNLLIFVFFLGQGPYSPQGQQNRPKNYWRMHFPYR